MWIVLILLLFCIRSFADEENVRAPPPNPARGETYDGRPVHADGRDAALAFPRIILFPLRLLVLGIEAPTKPGVEFEERHHLTEKLYYTFTSRDGQVGIRPLFTWYSTYRPVFGVHVFDHRLMGPGTRLGFDIAGFVDTVYTRLEMRPTNVASDVQVNLDTVFNRRNDYLYTGLGASAPLSFDHRPARYLGNLLDIGARVDLKAHERVTFQLGGYFGLRRFQSDEPYGGDPPIAQVYPLDTVPGFVNGSQFLRTSAGAHFDFRDNLIRPTLGALVNLEADYSHGLGDDDSSYFRIREAVSFEFSLWGGHSHVLVLRGFSQLVVPINDQPVPFTELSILGGPNDLRGFRWQEFRDFSSLFVSAEYRFPLIMWVDAALFVDWGGVFGKNYQGISADQMQPDIGLAFRLHSRDKFYLSFQVAYGFGNGWEAYLTAVNLP